MFYQNFIYGNMSLLAFLDSSRANTHSLYCNAAWWTSIQIILAPKFPVYVSSGKHAIGLISWTCTEGLPVSCKYVILRAAQVTHLSVAIVN